MIMEYSVRMSKLIIAQIFIKFKATPRLATLERKETNFQDREQIEISEISQNALHFGSDSSRLKLFIRQSLYAP